MEKDSRVIKVKPRCELWEHTLEGGHRGRAGRKVPLPEMHASGKQA